MLQICFETKQETPVKEFELMSDPIYASHKCYKQLHKMNELNRKDSYSTVTIYKGGIFCS